MDVVFCVYCGDPLRSRGQPPPKCPWCERLTFWLTLWDVDFLRINKIAPQVTPTVGTIES